MLLRYAILTLLDGQEIHGYKLKSVFEDRIGAAWSLNFGQIYQTLKDLRCRGLVDARFDRGDGHIGRWVYTVTPKGRRALDTWLRRSPKRPQPIRDEIFIRLLALDRKELEPSLNQIAGQERVYREHLTHLTACRRALEPLATEERLLNSLAADATVFYVEAHLKWLDHCRAVLQSWHPEDLGAEGTIHPAVISCESKRCAGKPGGHGRSGAVGSIASVEATSSLV